MSDDFGPLDFPVPTSPEAVPATTDAQRQQLTDALRRISELEKRVDRLTATCEVLRAALRKQGVVDDAEFITLGEDLKKQKQQGNHPRCRKCGKILQRSVDSCIYCGTRHAEVL